MAPRTRRASHGARAETERQALLLAVQALGVNAERVQEAERKQAEAERERDVAVQLLTTLLGKLEDAEVWKQHVLVLATDKGSTALVEALLKDDDVDNASRAARVRAGTGRAAPRARTSRACGLRRAPTHGGWVCGGVQRRCCRSRAERAVPRRAVAWPPRTQRGRGEVVSVVARSA